MRVSVNDIYINYEPIFVYSPIYQNLLCFFVISYSYAIASESAETATYPNLVMCLIL